MYKEIYIMKNKKEIALNKSFLLFVFIGVFILSLGCYIIIEKINAWSVGICIVGLLFLVGGMIKEPLCYGFDEEGITLYFVLCPKEIYLWKNIRRIKNKKDYSGSKPILGMIFSNVYEISGKVEGEKRFFECGVVSKSLRTKKLIEKYWHKKIEK